MPEPTSHRPGTPCWTDTASGDPERSAEFYGELFGWEHEDVMPDDTPGTYRMFRKDGKDVAAAGSKPDPSFPTVWQTYFATDDAEATAQAVQEAGGTVVMPPFDVMDAGRMAVFQDPQGAFFSAWEPKDMAGAQLVGEIGAMCWNELMTTDSGAAAAFYGRVFGWRNDTVQMGDGPPYHMQRMGEDGVAGIMDIQPQMGDLPPHWGVYFAVDDTDDTVSRTRELGGQLIAGPMDSPYGRFAVLQDPEGAVFSVVKLEMPDA